MGNLISGGYKIHWLVIRFLITWQFCRSIFKHSHRCHRFGMICLHICFETRTCLSLDGCVSQDSTLRLDGSCKNVRLETNTFFWAIAIFTKWPTRWLNFWISSKSESSVYTQLARFKPQVKRSSKRPPFPSGFSFTATPTPLVCHIFFTPSIFSGFPTRPSNGSQGNRSRWASCDRPCCASQSWRLRPFARPPLRWRSAWNAWGATFARMGERQVGVGDGRMRPLGPRVPQRFP